MHKLILIASTYAVALALAATAGDALGITVAKADRAAGSATSGSAPELLVSNFNTSAGKWAPLKARTTYQASAFPISLRLTPRDGTWAGAQWKKSSHGKLAFGWVAVGQGPWNGPRGLIELETAYGAVPSVAATIARLRVGGSHAPETKIGGITFREPSPAKIAGYSGRQFDGEVWGKFGHAFVPFSAKTHAGSPADTFYLQKGEVFRLIALDVRGKTVVLVLESAELPAEQFPAFLTSANRLLKTLRFPS